MKIIAFKCKEAIDAADKLRPRLTRMHTIAIEHKHEMEVCCYRCATGVRRYSSCIARFSELIPKCRYHK